MGNSNKRDDMDHICTIYKGMNKSEFGNPLEEKSLGRWRY